MRRGSRRLVWVMLACRYLSSLPGVVDTTGIDVSAEKVSQINAGQSYIGDVPDHDVAELVATQTTGNY